MWTALVIVLVLAYLLIAFIWGSFLNALTSPSGDVIKWEAVLHGLLWPASFWWLLFSRK